MFGIVESCLGLNGFVYQSDTTFFSSHLCIRNMDNQFTVSNCFAIPKDVEENKLWS